MTLVFSTHELPEPVIADQEQSTNLVNAIRREIDSAGGQINFARFMELALYSPDGGYYSTGKFIFGESGDFVTAPEISPIFSQCVARQCEQVLKETGGGDILEFGAGSGIMATEILRTLEAFGSLPNNYFIVDVSPGLISRQRIRIHTELPHLVDRVHWVSEVPANFHGVVVANEVLDAMPGHRIQLNKTKPHAELFVRWDGDRFTWIAQPVSPQLLTLVDAIVEQFGDSLPDGFISEINARSKSWLQNLAQKIERGAVILIDYGFPRREWYLPQRYEGTLMAHYKHRAHPDPFFLPGLQDLTYHVDFTQVAEEALEVGFSVRGFTNQAMFLVGCGLENILHTIDPTDVRAFITKTQAIKKLILPQEMGETFKVLGLTKDLDIDLIGFSRLDQRERL